MAKPKSSKKPAKKPAATPKRPSREKAGKAKPEPKVHAAIQRQGVSIVVPYGALQPSPLNPRKTFDEAKVASIGASIVQKGLLQNLTVRALKPGRYEIVIGETRWRAIGAQIKAKALPADFMVPVTVLDITDAEVVEIALIENTQRQDLTPLEEARGYAALRGLAKTTEEIAADTGIAKRTIQSRLTIVDRCAPQVLKALEAGEITVTHARTLAMASHKKQRELLVGLADNNVTEDELLGAITQDMPGTHLAFFPLDRYTGEIVTEEGTDNKYFADEALYLKLQEEAIAEKKAKWEADGKTVIVMRRAEGDWFHAHDWTRKPKDPSAVTVMEIGIGLDVKVHTGMVKRAEDEPQPGDEDDEGNQIDLEQVIAADKVEEEAIGVDTFTKAHRAHANRRKTHALQDAIADSPVMAMRLFCARMLDEYAFGMVLLRRADMPGNWRATVISPKVRALLFVLVEGMPAETQARFSEGQESDDQTRREIHTSMDSDELGAAVWARLLQLGDLEVANLFAALVAAQTGIWSDTLGCDDVEIAVADALGIAGDEAKHGLTLQSADLDGLRKAALLGVRQAYNCEDPLTSKAGELRDRIEGTLAAGSIDLVLPTLKFRTPEDTGEEIAKLVAAPRIAAVAAKAA